MRSIKALIVGLFCLALIAFNVAPAKAQSFEIQQLLLDVAKLAQFKSILNEMYDGYTILTKGYGTVKNLTQGNFNLHEVFLDGLLQVSPEVRKYARVADIIADESNILSEYKKGYSRFRNSGRFSVSELDYISNIYERLTSAALHNAADLADVLTASKLRMSDDERLSTIDRIYLDTNDKLQFLRSFNSRTGILQAQRQKQVNETQTLQNLYKP
ncbi:TerB family tellurite resistance protein [Pedobacter jejuensis]|uniref:TerB family tellurite resistance protein n=1 Tax=Pedobacter jejuensis TaxID=1268550 RepID=A0A3N0C082_9SPHI|nr:TerB family tellurite resistance protein [Pedobacter jejuensis]RNL55579.1 TerB family tellurite resistance protein [Pedobacter jejuensis]